MRGNAASTWPRKCPLPHATSSSFTLRWSRPFSVPRQRAQRNPTHRIGRAAEQDFDLRVVEPGAFLREPAAGLIMEVLQIIGSGSARPRPGRALRAAVLQPPADPRAANPRRSALNCGVRRALSRHEYRPALGKARFDIGVILWRKDRETQRGCGHCRLRAPAA